MKHFTEDSINLHISTPGSGGTTWTCTGRGRGGSWRGSTSSWLRWAVIGRGRVTWPQCSPLIGPGRQDGVPQVSFPSGVIPSLANHSNRWLQLHLFWQDDYKDDEYDEMSVLSGDRWHDSVTMENGNNFLDTWTQLWNMISSLSTSS